MDAEYFVSLALRGLCFCVQDPGSGMFLLVELALCPSRRELVPDVHIQPRVDPDGHGDGMEPRLDTHIKPIRANLLATNRGTDRDALLSGRM